VDLAMSADVLRNCYPYRENLDISNQESVRYIVMSAS